MTEHIPARQLRFFVTAESPCPYLPGRMERKVFANLPPSEGPALNDALTHAGFRRSQSIAYRPACETCALCVSVRIPVPEFQHSRSTRKVLNRNADVQRLLVDPVATAEQYSLLKRYLATRHPGGGMNDMSEADFVTMIEESAVHTHVVEYRRPGPVAEDPELIGFALIDLLGDGLSMVYSAFEPTMPQRSLGRYIVLDHVQQAATANLPYVYLGYWVQGSPAMDYKAGYRPLEALGLFGWQRLD